MDVLEIIAKVNGQRITIDATPGFGRGSIRVSIRNKDGLRTFAYPGDMDTERIARAVFLAIYEYRGTSGDIAPLVNMINMCRNEA